MSRDGLLALGCHVAVTWRLTSYQQVQASLRHRPRISNYYSLDVLKIRRRWNSLSASKATVSAGRQEGQRLQRQQQHPPRSFCFPACTFFVSRVPAIAKSTFRCRRQGWRRRCWEGGWRRRGWGEKKGKRGNWLGRPARARDIDFQAFLIWRSRGVVVGHDVPWSSGQGLHVLNSDPQNPRRWSEFSEYWPAFGRM